MNDIYMRVRSAAAPVGLSGLKCECRDPSALTAQSLPHRWHFARRALRFGAAAAGAAAGAVATAISMSSSGCCSTTTASHSAGRWALQAQAAPVLAARIAHALACSVVDEDGHRAHEGPLLDAASVPNGRLDDGLLRAARSSACSLRAAAARPCWCCGSGSRVGKGVGTLDSEGDGATSGRERPPGGWWCSRTPPPSRDRAGWPARAHSEDDAREEREYGERWSVDAGHWDGTAATFPALSERPRRRERPRQISRARKIASFWLGGAGHSSDFCRVTGSPPAKLP